jgi:hypothetical protein
MENTPRQFSNELMDLAEEYRKAGDELAKILVNKSSAILILKATCKTFKEAELQYGCTEEGKQELLLTMKMRGIKELLSASKTKLRVMSEENRNHY